MMAIYVYVGVTLPVHGHEMSSEWAGLEALKELRKHDSNIIISGGHALLYCVRPVSLVSPQIYIFHAACLHPVCSDLLLPAIADCHQRVRLTQIKKSQGSACTCVFTQT